jgi:hypothetical protein
MGQASDETRSGLVAVTAVRTVMSREKLILGRQLMGQASDETRSGLVTVTAVRTVMHRGKLILWSWLVGQASDETCSGLVLGRCVAHNVVQCSYVMHTGFQLNNPHKTNPL